MADTLALMVFPALVFWAALSDILTMKIPNAISIALVLSFCLFAATAGLDGAFLLSHFGAGAIMLVVGMVFFALGWVGGGDAKMVAGISLWLGLSNLLPYLIAASLIGGVLAFLFISFRRVPLPAFIGERDWVKRLHSAANGIPYGAALGGAAILVYPQTELFLSAVAG